MNFLMQGGPLDGKTMAVENKNDLVFCATGNSYEFGSYRLASNGKFVFTGYVKRDVVDRYFAGKV